jgi:hypothetical protein
MFEWDRNNLRKIWAHQIKREEVEQALLNDPIPVYEQNVEVKSDPCITAKPTRAVCLLWLSRIAVITRGL